MKNKTYLPEHIEKKWQDYWEKNKQFQADDTSDAPKQYILVEFPYPSGSGLHVGHVRSYTAMDIIARKKRMDGYNVLYPIGWDAFGLPTENYAIKHKIAPQKATNDNIAIFKEQIKSLGISFDWSREINTTDPNYYKWTQWIFLQLLKKGLAYKATMPINWCPSCKIGLANEEVVNGNCERCGTPAIKKEMSQWMLKITEYADRLIDDLDTVEYLDKIKAQQINWIGRSHGASIQFEITDTTGGHNKPIEVFTTRPDTIFGATYLVVSPEHDALQEYIKSITNKEDVLAYINQAKNKSDLERSHLQKEKTGVCLEGIFAINPINNKKIPVWIADYVLASYGTGAIMAVPAHDERDFAFATQYRLPIIAVISADTENPLPYTGSGILINSGEYNGITAEIATEKIISWLTENKRGSKQTNYKLRDWVFSRQHYWGEPIPVVYCEKCGIVPLDESALPLVLPEVEKYEPTETGESPLAAISDWVNTTCPKCGNEAKRETDTMPNWAGSSWYYIRYTDPNNEKEFASQNNMKKWLPVDLYNGGMEHTTLHLLYSRFWHKFLFDCGIVPTPEPYQKRVSHGMILAHDNQKMSKSKGNVVNPNDVIAKFGSDAMRVYEMFMGPYDEPIPWATKNIIGVRRFLEKIYKTEITPTENPEIEKTLNQTIKKVTEDIEHRHFNTAVSAMMIFINEAHKNGGVTKEQWKRFLIILSPFAPHIAEELHEELGFSKSITQEKWPSFDASLLQEDTVIYTIQVNGKVRAQMEVAINTDEATVTKKAKELENAKKYIAELPIKKTIFVQNKLVNFVV